MTDRPIDELADPRRIRVLVGSVLMLFVSGGGMYLIVVALKHIALEFDWPRAVPSFAISLQFIGSGMGGLLMGYLLDRVGFGVPAFIGAIMIGLGGLLASRIDAAWQLYLIYGIMFGLSGQGSIAAPALANIARWYDRRRGMAVGIVASGQALAGIVWPPIFGFVLTGVGWREMFLWFGAFALCAMMVLAFIVRHKPPPIVLPRPAETTGAADQARQARPIAPPLTPAAIQISLIGAIIGCCVAMSLPLTHLVALITDRGHLIHQAVGVMSAMLIAAFVSRALLLGLIADTLGGLRALFVFSFVQGAMLALLTVTQELWAFYAVAIAYGFGYGGVFPIYAVAIRDHLPIGEVGRRTGLIFLFGAAAMGLGSWLGGYLFDLTGSYTLPFLIGVAFNAGNLVIVGGLIYRLRETLPGRLARAAT